MAMIPSFTKVSKEGKTNVDLFSDALQNREIYIYESINAESALSVVLQLMHLDRTPGDIKIFINSGGGVVSDGFAIVDAIKRCKNDVSIICTGLSASMAAFILSCGTKGKRYVTPLSEVMIHQPLGGASGQATDIQLVANHICKTKKKLYEMLAENTGQPLEVIERDCERDYYMDAEEAIAYGIADAIYS